MNSAEFSLGRLARIIWRHLAAIIVVAIAFGSAGFAYRTYAVDNVYSSSAKVYVDTSSSNMTEYYQFSYALNAVDSYIAMLNSNRFYEKISEATDPASGGYAITVTDTDEDGNEVVTQIDFVEPTSVKYSPEVISAIISYLPINDTDVFRITATTKNRQDAQILADAAAKLANAFVSEIKSNANVSIVDDASSPFLTNSNRSVITLVSALIGAVLMTFVFVFLDLTDITVKSEEEFVEAYKYPLLGVIPDFDTKKKKKKKTPRRGSYGYRYYTAYSKRAEAAKK